MTDLQEAFREAARREFAMVPDESELDYAFSPGFQRKMQRIIRAQVHGYWNMVNTLGKRIAIAAVIIVMLLTTAMAIKPIRERVIKFFVAVYEEYFEIRFGANENGDLNYPIEPIINYTFSWVPDGYYEVKHMETEIETITIWKNDSNQGIFLSQGKGLETVTLNYAEENLSNLKHEDITIYYSIHDETTELLWEQDEYVFHLTLSKEMQMTDILQMISSLQEKNN